MTSEITRHDPSTNFHVEVGVGNLQLELSKGPCTEILANDEGRLQTDGESSTVGIMKSGLGYQFLRKWYWN